MKLNSKWTFWVLLFPVAVLIKIAAAFPHWVESNYATGMYPHISGALRLITGWLPFSLGDCLYTLLIGWVLMKAIGLRKTTLSRPNFDQVKKMGKKIVGFSMVLYVVFNLLWGLNYNRLGITHQLGIRQDSVNVADLELLDSLLINQVNQFKTTLLQRPSPLTKPNQILKAAINAYQAASARYPYLQYRPSSVKKSMWGWAGSYIGFTGYYNPFTGEAQVNTGVPLFLQPYIACHEIAHQLGYAREDEANLVGYLAASTSPEPIFRYSVYLDLFIYTQRALFRADSTSAKRFSVKLLPEVKADLLTLQAYLDAHRSPLEPVFRKLYGFYLRKNEQAAGINSYDEVATSLLSFYRKYGHL